MKVALGLFSQRDLHCILSDLFAAAWELFWTLMSLDKNFQYDFSELLKWDFDVHFALR